MFSHIITFGSSLPEARGGHSLCAIICERVLTSDGPYGGAQIEHQRLDCGNCQFMQMITILPWHPVHNFRQHRDHEASWNRFWILSVTAYYAELWPRVTRFDRRQPAPVSEYRSQQ
jgi:hypothetical protein